ncbi:choline dehydrogenase [Gandjariella thermophila]|uniref:Choline dehydrogenase n=1 Tax=Gandjariella thermophila TaxID=1931992 RepID=A0A4D4JEL6_9PSEU|nr:choline dehydrogenase [Gandjariella thermophila]
MADEADYIVVGAGSAGCIVARRLAESGARVVLLEAGPKDRSWFVRVPGMISIVHSVPQIKKRFDWGYYSVPQQHAMGRRIPMTRGKVLGGSSSVNGMVFVRGHRGNYDDWADAGCKGWSYDEVLPSFKRLEDWEDGENDLRGAGGPIAVRRQKHLTEPAHALFEAMAETLGVPRNDDYNGAAQEGVSTVQMSAHGGRRFSTSHGYLSDRQTPNLRVVVGATVTRVVFDGARAVGVEIVERSGPRVLRAAREVVLSAGVFGSPQILMLSGIGPADHLRDNGIDVRADLPVGDNLHDHLFVPMTFLAPGAVHRGTAAHMLGGILAEAVRGDTWFGSTVFDTMTFFRTDRANGRPDLQILTLPWSYPSPNQDAPVRHTVDTRPAVTVMTTLIYPKSRGTVRLASADPTAAPLIDPAYLADPDDARFLIDGMKVVREVMASRRLAGVVTGELHPGPACPDDDALARELPNRIHSVYHPVGTCRMGVDERAVVDPELRVRGVEGLRVADASIMPSITGGNTNAPAMMIGEHCAQLMRRGAQDT